MSCYFRYIKDIFSEAGIVVTPGNKKALDQAIHQIAGIPYKKCMPECWGEIKSQINDPKKRKSFISKLKKLGNAI